MITMTTFSLNWRKKVAALLFIAWLSSKASLKSLVYRNRKKPFFDVQFRLKKKEKEKKVIIKSFSMSIKTLDDTQRELRNKENDDVSSEAKVSQR